MPGQLSWLSGRLRLRSRSHGLSIQVTYRASCCQYRAHLGLSVPQSLCPSPACLLSLFLKINKLILKNVKNKKSQKVWGCLDGSVLTACNTWPWIVSLNPTCRVYLKKKKKSLKVWFESCSYFSWPHKLTSLGSLNPSFTTAITRTYLKGWIWEL